MFSPRAGGRSHLTTMNTEDLSRILNEESVNDKDGLVCSKVIFTLGPACYEVGAIHNALEAGGNCARLLLGWGTAKFHALCLANLQAACQSSGRTCGLIVETKGREVFVKSEPITSDSIVPIYNRKLEAAIDDKIVLTTRQLTSSSTDWLVPIQLLSFPASCSIGDSLVLAEYLSIGIETATLRLSVVDISETDVICIATSSASLEGSLVINRVDSHGDSHDVKLKRGSEPALSASDMSALKSLVGMEIDYLSLGHTQSVADIQFSRKILGSLGLEHVKILAKLETGRALVNSPEIVAQADGVILSRGSLSISVLPGKLALMQKAVISNTNLLGKPILVTSVSGSLVGSNQLARSDKNDIITAIMDGCDGIVLGAETHQGKNPAQAITAVLRVAKHGEDCASNDVHLSKLEELLGSKTVPGSTEKFSIALAQKALQDQGQLKGCLAFCQSGVPLEAVRRVHLTCPVLVPLARSKTLKRLGDDQSNNHIARQCSIYAGLLPFVVYEKSSSKGPITVSQAVKAAATEGLIEEAGSLLVASVTSNNGDQSFSVEELKIDEILEAASDHDESDMQSVFGRDQYEAALREAFPVESPSTSLGKTASFRAAAAPSGRMPSLPSSPRPQAASEFEAKPMPSPLQLEAQSFEKPSRGNESSGGILGPSTPEQTSSSPQTAEHYPTPEAYSLIREFDKQNSRPYLSQPEKMEFESPIPFSQGPGQHAAQNLLSTAVRSTPDVNGQYQLRMKESYPDAFESVPGTPPMRQPQYDVLPPEYEASEHYAPLHQRQRSAYGTPVPGSPRYASSQASSQHFAEPYRQQSSDYRRMASYPSAQNYTPQQAPPQHMSEQRAPSPGRFQHENYGEPEKAYRYGTPEPERTRKSTKPTASPFVPLREQPFPSSAAPSVDYNASGYEGHTPTMSQANGLYQPGNHSQNGRYAESAFQPPLTSMSQQLPNTSSYGAAQSRSRGARPGQLEMQYEPDGSFKDVQDYRSSRASSMALDPPRNDRRREASPLPTRWTGSQTPRGHQAKYQQPRYDNSASREWTTDSERRLQNSAQQQRPRSPYRYHSPSPIPARDVQGSYEGPSAQGHTPSYSYTNGGQDYRMGPPERVPARDRTPEYLRSQVQTVDEARSILAGSRARNSNAHLSQMTKSPSFEGSAYSLTPPARQPLYQESPRAAYHQPRQTRGAMSPVSEDPLAMNQYRTHSPLPGQDVRRGTLDHQRSITPHEARRMGLPEGVPISTPKSPRVGSSIFDIQDSGRYETSSDWRPRNSGKLPKTFEERPSLNVQSIPRVVGGKLVPSFQVGWKSPTPPPEKPEVDLEQYTASRRKPSRNHVEYESSSNVATRQPEVFRAPSPRASAVDQHGLGNAADRSRSTPRMASKAENVKLEKPDSPPRRPHKYNSHILTTSPDDFMWKADQKRRSKNSKAKAEEGYTPDHDEVQPQEQTGVQSNSLAQDQVGASPANATAMPQIAPVPVTQAAEIQPQAAEAKVPRQNAATAQATEQPVANGLKSTNASLSATGLQNTPTSMSTGGLSAATSTAEEKMKEYLVGEGIKRAHLRALYQKPAKPQKKSLFGRLFGSSSKAKPEQVEEK